MSSSGMRRVLVPTAGYALLSDSSLVTSLVKACVVGAVFGLLRWWMVRRQAGPRDDA